VFVRVMVNAGSSGLPSGLGFAAIKVRGSLWPAYARLRATPCPAMVINNHGPNAQTNGRPQKSRKREVGTQVQTYPPYRIELQSALLEILVRIDSRVLQIALLSIFNRNAVHDFWRVFVFLGLFNGFGLPHPTDRSGSFHEPCVRWHQTQRKNAHPPVTFDHHRLFRLRNEPNEPGALTPFNARREVATFSFLRASLFNFVTAVREFSARKREDKKGNEERRNKPVSSSLISAIRARCAAIPT